MIKKSTSIFIPIILSEEYKNHFSRIDKIFEELVQISGEIKINFDDHFISFLNIKIVNPEDTEIRKIFNNKYRKNLTILEFSSEIIINNKEELETKTDDFASFEHFVTSYTTHLIIYLNIAKPGAFYTDKGVTITIDHLDKKTKSSFPIIYNSIENSLRISKEYKWPIIKELPIKTTIDWLNNHWKAFETISSTKIQRALNAFSYLFHDNIGDFAPNNLFHALIGLEAIYVHGNSNIQDQVNQKSQLLLGKRNDFKKIFSELYDYRSRYIHGQLNFTNKYFSNDFDDQTIDQFLNTYNKSDFATAILIASIQKHIEMNKTEFEYELILK
jgi:hypothetical protein